jgi:hypothetical protein
LNLNIHNIRRYYWQPELINYPPKAKVLKHLAETTHKIPFISRQKKKERKNPAAAATAEEMYWILNGELYFFQGWFQPY